MKHNYTLSGELPEMLQAKLNAMNISEVKAFTRTDTCEIETADFACAAFRAELR